MISSSDVTRSLVVYSGLKTHLLVRHSALCIVWIAQLDNTRLEQTRNVELKTTDDASRKQWQKEDMNQECPKNSSVSEVASIRVQDPVNSCIDIKASPCDCQTARAITTFISFLPASLHV